MQRIIHSIQSVWRNDFARHNAILFGGNAVVSFVNYLYYPVLGRLLPTAAFGEVQALISIVLQATLFLGVIGNVAVNVIANETDEAKRSRFTAEMSRLTVLAAIVVVALAMIFVQPIQAALKFEEPLPFYLLGLSLILSAVTALRSAYLRGLSAFGSLSAGNLLASGSKLVLSAAFVAVGWGTSGAIGGLLAAQVVAALYLWRAAMVRGLRPPKTSWLKMPDLSVIRPQLKYTGLVLAVSLSTTALFSVDSLIVKHNFDPETAGEYGGVATIARIIYFLTGSVAMVLLSSVKLQSGRKANQRLLMRSAGITAALGGCVLAVFTIAPELVIRLLLGGRYEPLAYLLPWLGLVMFGLALVNLVFSYDLALRRKSVAVYAIAGLVLTATALWLLHDSPAQVVMALMIGTAGMLVLRGLDSLRRVPGFAKLRSE